MPNKVRVKLPPTIHEIMLLEEMANLAKACEINTNSEDIYDRCERAWEIYCDLRPHAKTAGEKARRAEDRRSVELLLRGDGFESVAYRMMPHIAQEANGPQTIFGLQWGNSPYHSGEVNLRTQPRAVITNPFNLETVEGSAPTIALALLAAILRAHVKWVEVWQEPVYENA